MKNITISDNISVKTKNNIDEMQLGENYIDVVQRQFLRK